MFHLESGGALQLRRLGTAFDSNNSSSDEEVLPAKPLGYHLLDEVRSSTRKGSEGVVLEALVENYAKKIPHSCFPIAFFLTNLHHNH
jgi:hypothetical protein